MESEKARGRDKIAVVYIQSSAFRNLKTRKFLDARVSEFRRLGTIAVLQCTTCKS